MNAEEKGLGLGVSARRIEFLALVKLEQLEHLVTNGRRSLPKHV